MTDEELTRRELRRKERQAIYNTKRWKDLRRLMVQEHPLCQDCLENGRLTPTEEVHHAISPFRRGLSPEEKERLAFDPDNLVCLCKECHIKRHMKDLPMSKKLDKYKD
jgi:5-methylcytosine-specific restriction protein A